MTDALADLKVADFSWVVAGPVVGRALADFGATVVRVESSTHIETARMMQPFYDGKPGAENSALYGTCNAGKLGLTLNLKQPEGQAVARDLIRWADVVIESFSPGQMERWGLDYESVRPLNPSVIMLSTSLMGQTGPAAKLAGYGNIGASASGYQDLVGWPDRQPIGPFGPYTDYVGPRFSLVLLLAALDRRRLTGQGCQLDVAQSEIGVFLLSPQLAEYFDRGTVAARCGNADQRFAPHGVFACLPDRDDERFAAIAVTTDAQWQALASEIDRDAQQRALASEADSDAQRRALASEIDSDAQRNALAAETDRDAHPRALPSEIGSDAQPRPLAFATGNDAPRDVLATGTGAPALVDDPRYRTEAGRLAASAELEEIVAAWTAGQRAEDVTARLQRSGVPAHVAASSADWSRDPQLAHRGHLRALPHDQFGTATVEGPRYLLSDTPGEVRRPAPRLGQDNEHVLRTLLGYDAATCARLADSGALT